MKADRKKHICTGLLAHVDAGKTTLSEAMLYTAGMIRKPGRVDHKDAFLDTDEMERRRGITIFSKQAELELENTHMMLLDTPGHVDFSSETERTLGVLDHAVLIISAREGVQGHTVTLWRLLEKYGVPTSVFVNKMDMEGADRYEIMRELKSILSEGCVDLSADDMEEIALCDEELLESYMETGMPDEAVLRRSIMRRSIFPVYFGSALRFDGVEELLEGLDRFAEEAQYGEKFAAKVYKITHDDDGSRLTHMKITGGYIDVKDVVDTSGKGDAGTPEKIDQIRVYSGERYRREERACVGEICAVTGLDHTYAGQGLGEERNAADASLKPALVYEIIPEEGADTHDVFVKLKALAEEDPQLDITWDDALKEIRVQLMGEVQLDVLKELIKRRFGISAEFGSGSIAYRETITESVIGSGHFEPLRHYAEAHILLEPGERGSGIVIDTACSEDMLDRNWQRLIMTHLAEKEYRGVLTGAPVTDIRMTLIAGKVHDKHTEGGDFRQATYRAVRQGLMKAKSALLEPWYDFRLQVPSDMTGRAMSDIGRMGGKAEPPETLGETTVLIGRAPVSEMKDYAAQVASYTKGRGSLTCVFGGYEECHDADRVIEETGYEPVRDIDNTADSVFCSHGAGVTVPWDEADGMMHIKPVRERADIPGDEAGDLFRDPALRRGQKYAKSRKEEEAELDRIFEMTYGKPKERRRIPPKTIEAEKVKTKPLDIKPEYIIVDGYNMIFAWEELKQLAKTNLDSAREALIEILANHRGYRNCRMTVVFDAYKVKGGERRHEKIDGLDIVFTKESETADTYIERLVRETDDRYMVRVATSDSLEQLTVWGGGAFRISAAEFRLEIEKTDSEISEFIEKHNRMNSIKNRRGIDIPGKTEE